MKRVFTFPAIPFVILILSSSCSVTRRQFRNGWHGEWNRTSVTETAIEAKAETVPAATTIIRPSESEEMVPSSADDLVPPEHTNELTNEIEDWKRSAIECRPARYAGAESVQKLNRTPGKVIQTIAFSDKKQLQPNTAARSQTVVRRDPDDGEFLGIANHLWVDYLIAAAWIIGICALVVLAIQYPFVALLLGVLMGLGMIIAVIWVFWKIFSFFGDYLFWSGR